MSAILEAITELETRRREIEDAIVVLRRLLPNAKPNGTKPAVAKPRAPSTGGGRKVDPTQNAEIRRLYEAGVSAAEIERRTGVRKATIYYRASAGSWKRPPAGEALPGRVRCPACSEWTDRDPCTSCGKAVRA